MANRSKDPVRLRRRETSYGRLSLYLDIYVDGRRSYEYLRLYLEPEVSRSAKEKNRETLKLAEAVRAKRLVDVQQGRFGFKRNKSGDVSLLEAFRTHCEKSVRKFDACHSVLSYLELYCKPGTRLCDITPAWVNGFRDFLDSADTVNLQYAPRRLAENTKVSYFAQLWSFLNKAYMEGRIPENPLRNVQKFRPVETERPYLTLDDLRSMAATECSSPVMKRAFLFSCLTGLRKSDILALRWGDVREENGFTRIVFRQKKTRGLEYLDLSPEAVPFLGERRADDTRVFEGFSYSSRTLYQLKYWAERSGVHKDFGFHAGRHTFALLMLTLGADLYTVSKLLGHRDIKTTQIYAKILDDTKRDAVAKIPSILGGGK